MSEIRPAGGAVLLDVGADTGALIVQLDPEHDGTELHLRRDGDVGSTVHTGVWRRDVGARRITVAVFGSLPIGGYSILDDEFGEPALALDIRPGYVLEVDRRTGRSPR